MPSFDPDGACAPVAFPLLVFAGITMLSVLVTAPLLPGAWAGQAPEVIRGVRTGLWVLVAVSPILGLARGLALTAMAWSLLLLLGAEARYRALLSVTLFGELILSTQGLWIACVLRMRGVGGTAAPEDLRVFTGLDILLDDPSSPLGALASAVTPFHAAWAVFLAWGFSSLSRGGRVRGAAAAALCWGLAAGTGILRALAG
jgi:hypothetical protein